MPSWECLPCTSSVWSLSLLVNITPVTFFDFMWACLCQVPYIHYLIFSIMLWDKKFLTQILQVSRMKLRRIKYFPWCHRASKLGNWDLNLCSLTSQLLTLLAMVSPYIKNGLSVYTLLGSWKGCNIESIWKCLGRNQGVLNQFLFLCLPYHSGLFTTTKYLWSTHYILRFDWSRTTESWKKEDLVMALLPRLCDFMESLALGSHICKITHVCSTFSRMLTYLHQKPFETNVHF